MFILLLGMVMPALHAPISLLPVAGFTIVKMSSWSYETGAKHHVDAGLNFSIGCELPQGLFMCGECSRGFTDINKSFSRSMYQRNRAWGISLGYKTGC